MGYWPKTYWPKEYWPKWYWPEVGSAPAIAPLLGRKGLQSWSDKYELSAGTDDYRLFSATPRHRLQ